MVTVASVVVAFAVCWVPYFTVFVVKPFVASPIDQRVDLLTLWLGYANSSVNPFLYAFYNSSFRDGFRRVLCRPCPCCSDQSPDPRRGCAGSSRRSERGSRWERHGSRGSCWERHESFRSSWERHGSRWESRSRVPRVPLGVRRRSSTSHAAAAASVMF